MFEKLFSLHTVSGFLSVEDIVQLSCVSKYLYSEIQEKNSFWLLEMQQRNHDFQLRTDFSVSAQHLLSYLGFQNHFVLMNEEIVSSCSDLHHYRAVIPFPLHKKTSFFKTMFCSSAAPANETDLFVYYEKKDTLTSCRHLFYFEVTITGVPEYDEEYYDFYEPTMAIGLNTLTNQEDHPILLGWYEDTIAFHTDDGKIYCNGVSDEEIYPVGTGATIGCGVDHRTHSYFITLNGSLMFSGDVSSYEQMYPTVMYDHTDWTFDANFGGKPFMYPPVLFQMDVRATSYSDKILSQISSLFGYITGHL